MTYLPENDMLISCSSSSKESLVFRSLDERKRKTYIFKVTKVNVTNLFQKSHLYKKALSSNALLANTDPLSLYSIKKAVLELFLSVFALISVKCRFSKQFKSIYIVSAQSFSNRELLFKFMPRSILLYTVSKDL